jgi:hypothetical protein
MTLKPTSDKVNSLDYWVQQAIPLVYDDSLSYSELLAKVVATLNAMTDQWNEIVDWVAGPGLTDQIDIIMAGWLADGTIADIINQDIMDQKADITYVDAELDKVRNFINVMGEGVTGGGVTNDAPAIQAILNLATLPDSKGISLWFPPGIYALESELHVKRNTYILAHPNAVFLRKHNDDILTNYVPLGGGDDIYGGYTGHGNIVVMGGVWDANANNYPDVGTGIGFAHADNCVFRDLTIKDIPVGHALELTGCRNILVENCKFLGYNVATSGNTYSEAIQIEGAFPPAETGYTYGYKIDYTPTINVTVRDCYFGPSDTFPAHPCGVGSHGARYAVFYDNIKIIDNHFVGQTYWSIRPFKFRRCKVDGNTIESGTGGGIYIVTPSGGLSIQDSSGVTQVPEPLEHFVVTNNHIRNMSGDGIQIEGTDVGASAYIYEVVIQGNTIKDVTGKGMDLSFIRDFTCEGNSLNNITGTIIEVDNIQRGTMFGNQLFNGGANGFFLVKTMHLNLFNNVLDTIKQHGFNISGDVQTLSIKDNRLTDASQMTTNTYDGILISTGASNIHIVGNVMKGWSTNKMRYGINIQTGVTGVVRYGNDVRVSAGTANLNDLSTSPTTTSADIVA